MKRFVAGVAFVGLCACQQIPPVKMPTAFYGVVHYVNTTEKFVLVRMIEGTPQKGVVLVSSGLEGATANLQFTGETSGDFYACDIRSGAPAVGNSVRIYPNLAKPKKDKDETDGKENPQQPKPKTATEAGKPILI